MRKMEHSFTEHWRVARAKYYWRGAGPPAPRKTHSARARGKVAGIIGVIIIVVV